MNHLEMIGTARAFIRIVRELLAEYVLTIRSYTM